MHSMASILFSLGLLQAEITFCQGRFSCSFPSVLRFSMSQVSDDDQNNADFQPPPFKPLGHLYSGSHHTLSWSVLFPVIFFFCFPVFTSFIVVVLFYFEAVVYVFLNTTSLCSFPQHVRLSSQSRFVSPVSCYSSVSFAFKSVCFSLSWLIGHVTLFTSEAGFLCSCMTVLRILFLCFCIPPLSVWICFGFTDFWFWPLPASSYHESHISLNNKLLKYWLQCLRLSPNTLAQDLYSAQTLQTVV